MTNGIGRVGWRNYVAPTTISSIITNGLILNLDAGNTTSYSGTGTTWTDLSGNGNATLVNGAAYSSSDGGTMVFDGINDYAGNGSNYLVSSTQQSFTANAWVKMSGNPISGSEHHPSVINLNGASLGYLQYMSFGCVSDRKIKLRWFNGGQQGKTGNSVLDLNTWYYISCSVSSNVIKLYVNGIEETSYTGTDLNNRAGDYSGWTIGNSYWGQFNGNIPQVQVYNRGLTPTEILQNFNSTKGRYGYNVTPTYPSSLKFFIDAGNTLSYSGTGTTVTDLTGTQNGTLINGTSYSSANGGTFVFDGINDYIDFGINTAIQPVATATYNMWLNFAGPGTPWSFSPNGIRTWYDAGGIRFLLGSSSTYQYTTYSNNGSLIQNNNWYYLTLSIDGSTIKTYVNGVLQKTIVQTIIPTNGINPLKIGQMNDDNWPMNGKISQMKIYNEMRSEAQTLADFNEFKSRYGY
jgi:hypothetical protein